MSKKIVATSDKEGWKGRKKKVGGISHDPVKGKS
jgi:hypothetical protein